MDMDFPDPLPPVAAEFRIEKSAGDVKSPASGIWRLWREPERVQRDFPASETTEVWRRDGGALFQVKYFHEAHRGIEFQQSDLSMLGALPAWQQVGLGISPELITQLQPVGSGETDGHAWHRFSGMHAGVHWDITLRDDLMLPVSVERKDATETEQVTLLGAWSLDEAPWRPVDVDGYDVLDFADLGDHEHDPFVMAVEGHLGLAHDHGH